MMNAMFDRFHLAHSESCRRRARRARVLPWCAASGTGLIAACAMGFTIAPPAGPSDDVAAAPSKPLAAAPAASVSFVRRVDRSDGASVLEVASRRFAKTGEKTEVSLVGAVHIGTPDYYRSVQALLDEHALVLYESVTPRGAVHEPSAVSADPVRATRDAMLFLRRAMIGVRDLARQSGDAPASAPSIAETVAQAHRVDSRFEPWVRHASQDAWGRPIEVEGNADGSFLLVSRGADGLPGGTDADADIRLRTPHDRRASSSEDEALQPQLASLLGLAFQLQAVDYHRTAWVVADMSEGQFLAELESRGIDGGPFMRTLSGSSFTASLAGASVALIRVADGLSGGKVRAFVKFMMIEALSMADERMIARGMPEGFADVILHRRNDVAYTALVERLGAAERPASIAVFYGAAHMPDLERRLIEAGWTQRDEKWISAVAVNPKAVGLDAATVAQMRAALREMMREMGQAEERP